MLILAPLLTRISTGFCFNLLIYKYFVARTLTYWADLWRCGLTQTQFAQNVPAKFCYVWVSISQMAREQEFLSCPRIHSDSFIICPLLPYLCVHSTAIIIPSLLPYSCQWHSYFPCLPSIHLSKFILLHP